jgi:hypothetical protein
MAFAAAKMALQRAKCEAFYGGKGCQRMDDTNYRRLAFKPRDAAAATLGPKRVVIQPNGDFLYPPAEKFGVRWDQAGWGGQILLHELGHQLAEITGFQPDNGQRAFNESQTMKVMNACF